MIDDAKNADELWKVRKLFDNLMPNSVKNLSAAPSFQAETLADFWKATRNAMNDSLDDIVKRS
jgi:hypothetical protein